MKKRPLSRILFFPLLLLFLVLFAFLGIRTFYHAAYTPETCTETVEELSNPYIGFYHMYGYVPGSGTLSHLPSDDNSDSEEAPGRNMELR